MLGFPSSLSHTAQVSNLRSTTVHESVLSIRAHGIAVVRVQLNVLERPKLPARGSAWGWGYVICLVVAFCPFASEHLLS